MLKYCCIIQENKTKNILSISLRKYKINLINFIFS